MFLDIKKDISKLHAIACRLLFFTAVVFGTDRASAAEDYVFMYNNYFLGSNTTTPTTDFVPNASIYTGTSGSTFKNGNGYYINIVLSSLQFSEDTGSDLIINNNNNIYYDGYLGDYYLNMQNPNNNNRNWRTSNTTQNRATAYTVTTSAYINDFTVSGDATITTTGTNSSYTHTDAEYYDIYTFNSLTYYSTDASAAASTTAPTSGLPTLTDGYTWTISDNSYATVDASTGAITVNSLPASDANVTLTCSVTRNGVTKTATKNITLQSPKDPTAITASNFVMTVGTDDEISYTLTGTSPVYDNVVGTSSNTGIFTVVSDPATGGQMTLHPVAVGSATLTLTAKKLDGTTAATATVTVTVGEAGLYVVVNSKKEFGQNGDGSSASGITSNYYLYPTSSSNKSVLKVNYLFTPDRIWRMNPAAYTTTMQNYATGFYIRHTEDAEAEGSVKMDEVDAPTATTYRYRFEPFGDYYAIKPYQYISRNQNQNSSFNPYANNNRAIGMYKYNGDIASQWRYYRVNITDVHAVLADFTVSGTDVLYATGASDAYTHTNVSFTIPYTTYSFNNETHNWYNDTDNGTTTPSAEELTDASLYKWSLSSNSYATVDANTGVITVNSLPTSGDLELTLTCKLTYGTYTKTATKAVTIAAAQNPTSITASDKTLTVGTDDDITYTLATTGNYTPYDLVYATSSDESIFTVVSSPASGGTVTLHPVTPGQATLTLVAKQTDGTTDACSTTVNITVGDKVSTPTITYVLGETNTTVTITCATEGASIYYTTDGSAPTTSSTLYEGAFTISSSSLPKTVKAIAVKTYYTDSEIAEKIVNYGSGTSNDPYIISSVSDLAKLATYSSAYFKVVNDFNASSFEGNTTPFTGHLDGGYFKISGLTHPLFNRATGATIKNVTLDNVSLSSSVTVSGTTCLGAIAAYADGNTKIYNCGILATTSSSVSGGNNTGSLVGYLAGNARVVNNYSYANVTGEAGIVGHVAGTALTNDNHSSNNHCAVTNNMFYGDLKSGTSPVYGGNHTSNIQEVNEYNFWRSKASVSYTAYNNQLAIDKDSYLNRFPFYRHIQNTHRELAAIYLFGERTNDNVAEIGHWYNVKNDATIPYPIIEEWKTNTKRTTVDIAANLPNTTEKYAGKLLSSVDSCYTGAGVKVESMGKNGYLTVNVSINGSNYSSQLPITDMDTLNYDFTWGKVVLPHANEYSGWTRDYSKICTGWKITGITGGTTGTLTNYNFADRDCTAKDIYDATNNNYIFAQGGNYIVPYGVTAINIEANFANAFYLSDAYYDIGYNNGYGGATNLTVAVPEKYHGQTVYTNLNTLMGAMADNVTHPHQQAIVLVGNYHYNQNTIGGNIFSSYTTKGLTIMSVDEDCNQEPDYGWYSYHTTDRTAIPPMRFDFVPNIGIGMAARTTGSTAMPTIGIWHARGWFELTETCVSMMSECEINSGAFNATENGKGNNRWIANSGYFIQIVRCRKSNCSKLSYIQIGGNAYVEQLYPGSHTDDANVTTIRPINVTGGEIEECYMTGYRAGATATGANIYFWCAGGKIHKYLSAYMENPNTSGVNVTAKVDHAYIKRFFGGGTSTSAPITGNINITMNNSWVGFYCGGPEFGDMASGKTVTTTAYGSTFGQYYGAGFGGTSITYNREGNNGKVSFNSNTVTYPLGWGNYKRLTYNSSYGIGSCYDFEFILYSGGGGTGVARFYTGYAAFSLARTGNVTNRLGNCTVVGDYYGAGCQGTVNGTVNSTLTSCTLMKSAFGGGYKAAANEVKVYPATQPTYSVYTRETGLFSDFGTVAPETYTWAQGTAGESDATNKILYTTTDMTQLGNVTGAITLDIKGGTVAYDVFGGGNESKSLDNTTVTIQNNAAIGHNVYGGGNVAEVGTITVSGSDYTWTKGGVCNVEITGGTIGSQSSSNGGDVFGAGKGYADEQTFTCDKAMVSTANVSITNGIVYGTVYGGGEIGRVENNTTVTIGHERDETTAPVIKGDVFGAGKGLVTHGYSALVRGNATVIIQGNSKVENRVFGGGMLASVGKYQLDANGLPHSLVSDDRGICRVTIRDNAVIGPDGMEMLNTETGKPDDTGYVVGAGRGILPYEGFDADEKPWRVKNNNTKEEFCSLNEAATQTETEKNYFKFIGSLGLATQTYVTIGGNAYVKGSVYGGSMTGYVQYDTHVYIQDNCQIGQGGGTDDKYTETQWTNEDPSDFKECNHWPYTAGVHTVFDPYVETVTESNGIQTAGKYADGTDANGGVLVPQNGQTFYGNVFAGGCGYYPFAPGRWLEAAGTVGGDTYLTMTGGHVLTSVYGGNEMTDVKGNATVTITGGTLGVPRTKTEMENHPVTCYVFGGGKGDQRTWFNTKTNIEGNATVTVKDNARIFGSTFGGGEDGHVFGDVTTIIGELNATDKTKPIIGSTGTSSVDGNIFGGGRGFTVTAYTAGSIGGNATTTINSGTIMGTVYGGGRLASVGSHFVNPKDENGDPDPLYGTLQDDTSEKTHGHVTININGGTIGATDNGVLRSSEYSIGDVFGGCKGTEYDDDNVDPHKFGVAKITTINVNDGTINGSVYGGGEMGGVFKDTQVTVNDGIIGKNVYGGGMGSLTNGALGEVHHNVQVDIEGGTIGGNVYGGGAIANTNTHDERNGNTADCKEVCTTKVNLTGGLIKGDAYGGGEGEYYVPDPSNPVYDQRQWTTTQKTTRDTYGAQVYGNVTVTLNGTAFIPRNDATQKNTDDSDIPVAGRIFGCNNYNGSPKGTVLVHVKKTVPVDANGKSRDKAKGTYDLQAVYGGGNLAGYLPYSSTLTATGQFTKFSVSGTEVAHTATQKPIQVVIEGCDATSIKYIYGGGNAADVPATDVLVLGAYEIGDVFGGGNGKDKIHPSDEIGWIDNFGADVGAYWYNRQNYDGTTDTYGTGIATTSVLGGTVHNIFGGSNTLGNIYGGAVTTVDSKTDCPLVLDELYGGGNEAYMVGGSNIILGCISYLKQLYGGAKNADVGGNVNLTITSGHFDRVFGGNNISGNIDGSITLNIEETGCNPITIGELYGGGNQAAYSVYGYDSSGNCVTSGTAVYADPVINIRSFTSIGRIFGGGLGEDAIMYANPTININEVTGDKASVTDWKYISTADSVITYTDGSSVTLPVRAANAIGAIRTVFGGGNAAKVVGNTTVNIGTETTTTFVSIKDDTSTTDDERVKNVEGVDIRENVYGGGNAAVVEGSTNVTIGQ